MLKLSKEVGFAKEVETGFNSNMQGGSEVTKDMLLKDCVKLGEDKPEVAKNMSLENCVETPEEGTFVEVLVPLKALMVTAARSNPEAEPLLLAFDAALGFGLACSGL